MSRELPWVKDSMRAVVPGIGEFALQSVGNTSYSTAVHVYLLPEGSDKRSRGAMDFKLAITAEFEFEWWYDGVALAWFPNENVFSNAQVAAGLSLVQTYHERDDISFMFLVLSQVEMELKKHRYQLQRFESSMSALQDAIAKGRSGNLSRDELIARRDRTTAAHDKYVEEHSERMERLEFLERAIRSWTHKPRNDRSIIDVMIEAAKGPNVPAPAAALSP